MKRTIALGSLAIMLAIVIVEAGVRAFVDDGMQYDLEMWKYAKDVKRVAASPALGHEHAPGAAAHLMGSDVKINSLRLRDREIPYERTPGVLRILMIGDSVTFGWGVGQEETTSKRLEKLLNDANIRAEVINAGVGNYNTAMEVEYFLSDGLKYTPDLVVLNYFINDAEPTPVYSRYGWWATHSYAYAYLAGRLDMLMRRLSQKTDWREYYTGLYAADASGWDTAKKLMRLLAETCAARKIRLLVVHYPELRILADYPFRSVERLVRTEAERLGIAYLDLHGAVRDIEPSKLWVTPPDPHPNALAHALFARAIFDLLEPTLGRR
jgi:lysophospholipase L1-like esterase